MRKNTDAEVRRRRLRVAQLYRLGAGRAWLSRKFHVSPRQINMDLEWVRKHFRALLGEEKLAELRVEVMEELDLVRAEAKRGWRRSLRSAKRVNDRTVTDPAAAPPGQPPAPPTKRETTRTVEAQAGDPRFLAELRQAGRDLRELLGLDAPRKVAPTLPDGQPLPALTFIEFAAAAPSPNGHHANGHAPETR